MNKLFVAASVAALVTIAGTMPSLAQSSSGAASAMMPSVTCRDLSAMDPQTAKNVVFYLGGLNAAAGASSAMNSTGASGSSSTAADSGTTSSTTSDTTGSTTAAGSSGASDTSSSGTGSGASGAVMAQLPGFSGINADQILSTCQGSPDTQLSEVIGSGAATAQ